MKNFLIARFIVFEAILFVGKGTCLSAELIYTYDDLNRFERIEKPDTYIIEYFYDSVGNRTSKTIVVTLPDFDSDGDSVSCRIHSKLHDIRFFKIIGE